MVYIFTETKSTDEFLQQMFQLSSKEVHFYEPIIKSRDPFTGKDIGQILEGYNSHIIKRGRMQGVWELEGKSWGLDIIASSEAGRYACILQNISEKIYFPTLTKIHEEIKKTNPPYILTVDSIFCSLPVSLPSTAAFSLEEGGKTTTLILNEDNLEQINAFIRKISDFPVNKKVHGGIYLRELAYHGVPLSSK